MSTNTIKVWDPVVRVFHWSLVVSFMLAYLSEDDFLNIHLFAGYSIAVLLAIRIIWGLIGTHYARFTNFSYKPTEVIEYLKSVLAFRAKHYLGHNPAGSAMIFAMLISLLLTLLFGFLTYGSTEFAGPLAGFTANSSEWLAEAYEEIHEFFANLTLLLVFAHVAGVLLASLQHHENLIKSMINGYKKRPNLNHEEEK